MATGAGTLVQMEDPDNPGNYLTIPGVEQAPNIGTQKELVDVTGIDATEEWDYEAVESGAPDYDFTVKELSGNAILDAVIAKAKENAVVNMRHTYGTTVTASFKIKFADTGLPPAEKAGVLKRDFKAKMVTKNPVWGTA